MPKILRGSMLTNSRQQLIREIAGYIDETGCRFVYLVPTPQLQKEIKIALFQYIEEIQQGQGEGVSHFALPDPHIHLFDGFVNEILKDWWEYQPPIPSYQQRMILKMVTDELYQSDQLSVLQGMVEYDGFYTSLIQWLKEVKKTGQSPVEWLQHSHHIDETKESQLGLIYQQYEEFLDTHDLVDEERNYEKVIQKIADSNLTGDHQLSQLLNQLELVIIDGFYKLNQLQIRLVKSLIDRGIDVWVSLVQDEERKDIFLSTTEMVDHLLKLAEDQGWEWAIGQVLNSTEEEPSGIFSEKSCEDWTPVLNHLTKNLFNLSAQPMEGNERIQILHMPDPYQEMEQIGRMIKKAMLADDNMQADQIAVILRNVDSYHFYIEEIFQELGIPYQISEGTKLSKLPIFKLILKLYQLFTDDWSRESFLEILKSPYLEIANVEEIEQLEHMILEAGIIKGEQEWLTKLRRFERRLVAELKWVVNNDQSLSIAALNIAEDINTDQLSEIQIFLKKLTQKRAQDSNGIDREKVDKLFRLANRLKQLRHFLGFLQPLIKNLKDLARKQNLRQHCQALLQFFFTYQLNQQVVENVPADQQQLLRRDLVSLDQLQNLLVEIIHLGELLDAHQKQDSVGGTLISYNDFLYYLKTAAEEVHIPEPQIQLNGVQVLTSSECRGRKFKLVFVSGLVEGECPYYRQKDWLFKPEERKALKAYGIHFQQFYERLEEERLFFLEAVSTAREKLVLTCPAWQSDETVQSSSFIEEVLNLYTDDSIQRRDLVSNGFGFTDNRIASDQPLTQRELDESYLRERWLMKEKTHAEVAAVDAGEWTLPLPAKEWERLDELYRRGEMIQQREGNEFSQYDGLLKNEEIQKEMRKKYHKDRVYSISELNTFAVCPFQFFGNRILGLEQVEEPTLRLEPLDLGNLYHQILYHFFKEFPGWEEESLEAAHKRMEVVVDQEMAGYLPGESLPDGLWDLYQEEIQETLSRILNYEYEEAGKQSYQMLPTHLEASFGRLKETFRETDSLNLEEPVILRRKVSDGVDGEITVKFKGKIDRIDQSRDGRYVIIYDYKFGSRDGFTDMEAGTDLQLPIYIRAAQLLCGEEKEVLGAGYFALIKCDRKSGIWRDRRQDLIPVTSRSKSCLDEESWQEILTQVDQYVIDYIQRIRQGDFRVNPAKCPDYCKFKKICRYDQTRIRLKEVQDALGEGGDNDEL